ncbi:MAG: hypothetical protein A3D67_01530 [Candidatus Lloydbacteria bacterium RIFCSPHIGHO2_02_FULL_51_22]|uniref:Uncharacterized protein n=1 Tax=Candidatus Lloydbacteria bacterium RIFCSPHIGHO2_02_FULL_51_22 TaxID=1798663 RepID=A0A1G2D5L4_9BACT|nr:MAG: hypothetical protein A3D67_01530 [Candidatus Lloydbacteria bacterium RIFCSPHIGHO2_02_FULL_51_22]
MGQPDRPFGVYDTRKSENHIFSLRAEIFGKRGPTSAIHRGPNKPFGRTFPRSQHRNQGKAHGSEIGEKTELPPHIRKDAGAY